VAAALNSPSSCFSYQAVSAWLNGARNPSAEHRRILALILDVPLDELNLHCDGPVADYVRLESLLRRVKVHVRKEDRQFSYILTVAADIDITRPAVYEKWTDMFNPWPTALMKHFARMKYKLFGWIPTVSSPVLVHRAMSLVPLERRVKLPEPDSPQKQIWFLYLPDGQLSAGVAFRDGRWLKLLGLHSTDGHFENYPLSRIEPVGCVTGKSLLRLESLPQ